MLQIHSLLPNAISHCLPSCFSPAENEPHREPNSSLSLKDRFCANWHLIPIILTMCSCVIGFVACFFYFGQPYFSIIFVVGFGGSLFALYQAHKITQLENFAENNARLESTAEQLEQELRTAKENADQIEVVKNQLQAENQQLKDSVENLGKQLAGFQQELQNLGAENSTLKASNERLEQIKFQLEGIESTLKERIVSLGQKAEEYEALYATQMAQLKAVNQSLEDLKKEGGEQLLKFDSTHERFETTLISQLKTTQNIQVLNSEFGENIQKNDQTFTQVVGNLKDIFRQSDEKVKTLANISDVVKEKVSQLQTLLIEVGKLEGSLAIKQEAFETLNNDYKLRLLEQQKLNEHLSQTTTQITTHHATVVNDHKELHQTYSEQNKELRKSVHAIQQVVQQITPGKGKEEAPHTLEVKQQISNAIGVRPERFDSQTDDL